MTFCFWLLPIYFASWPWCSTQSEFIWTCKGLTTGLLLKASTTGCFLAVLSPSSLPACFVEGNGSRGRANAASKRDMLQKLDVSSQAYICCWHLLTVCEGISNSRVLLDSAVWKGGRLSDQTLLLGFTAVMHYRPGHHHTSWRDRRQNVTYLPVNSSH